MVSLKDIFFQAKPLVDRLLKEMEPHERAVWATAELLPSADVGVPDQLQGDLKSEL